MERDSELNVLETTNPVPFTIKIDWAVLETRFASSPDAVLSPFIFLNFFFISFEF